MTRSESPKGGNGTAPGVLDVAASTATAAVAGAADVMGRTINEVQQAIENIQKDDSTTTRSVHGDAEDEQDQEQDSLGIGSGTRAKLAEQAKRANDQRDKQRESVGVDGLVYSDESDDDEDDSTRRDLGRTNGNGNGNGNGRGSIPSIGATAIPLPTSPGDISPGGGRRLSPTPSPGLAERLEPALNLSSTSRESRNSGIPAKPPLSWNVDDVVSWATAKGFDESICDKFKGELKELPVVGEYS